MDPKLFGSHFYHHHNNIPQSMHPANDLVSHQLLPPDGQSMTDYFMHQHHQQQLQQQQLQQLHHHHQQQQQQQQQQQYRNDIGMSTMVPAHNNALDLNINAHTPEPPPPIHHPPQKKKENHHQGATYTCSEVGCPKTFTHKNSLTAHLKTHGIETKRVVDTSDPSSPAPSALHQCPDCDKTYKSQGGLYWHHQTVHKKRVFNCSQCSKVYKSYPGFYLHSKTHDGGSYECPHCSKAFGQKSTLKNHMKIHLSNGNESSSAAASAAAGREEGGNHHQQQQPPPPPPPSHHQIQNFQSALGGR